MAVAQVVFLVPPRLLCIVDFEFRIQFDQKKSLFLESKSMPIALNFIEKSMNKFVTHQNVPVSMHADE